MPTIWQRVIEAINLEYERRVRAASLVETYGFHHPAQEEEGEVAVIANVPRGTRLQRPTEPPGPPSPKT
jgi:hypothetical protein